MDTILREETTELEASAKLASDTATAGDAIDSANNASDAIDATALECANNTGDAAPVAYEPIENRWEVERDGRRFILVGTAHVSEKSIADVRQTLNEFDASAVVVELDADRYKTLTQGNDWSKLTISSILKQKKGMMLLASLALGAYQRRINPDMPTPGLEMKEAAIIANERDIPLILGDRAIDLTLKRIWRCSSLVERAKMLGVLFTIMFDDTKMDEEDLEHMLNDEGGLDKMIKELAEVLPRAGHVLLDERNQYLATNIYFAPGDTVVAIVGAAHVPGIMNCLEALAADQTAYETKESKAREELKEISHLPEKAKWTKLLPWIVPAVVCIMLGIGISRGVSQGISILSSWALVNAIGAGLGAILALAHPLTILVSAIAAPFTSLVPTIGVGFIAGALESTLRKPRIQDFEQIQEDSKSLKAMYKNRFIHALIVFFLSSLGSSIGTFIGLPILVKLAG